MLNVFNERMERMQTAKDQLIVALDLPTLDRAMNMVDTLGDLVDCYQVSMEAFYGMGHILLAQLAGRGKKIFMDFKLHDIPTTVANTVTTLCQFSPAFLTLHAAGGSKMLEASITAANEWEDLSKRPRPKLLAITVLTSIGERDWMEIGHQSPIRESVLRMSVMCKEEGLDGVVASPREAAAIRALCGPDFLIVTPGIRLSPEQNADQMRTATPSQALKVGANYLVVGRPIVSASDPCAIATEIIQDMKQYIEKK
jgi:orotidine-5'-phosphate decarboxylase